MGDVVDCSGEGKGAQRRSPSPLPNHDPSMCQAPATLGRVRKFDVLHLQNVAAPAPVVETAPLHVERGHSGCVDIPAPKEPAIRPGVICDVRCQPPTDEVVGVDHHNVGRITLADPLQPLVELQRFVSATGRDIETGRITADGKKVDLGMPEVELWNLVTHDDHMKAGMGLSTDRSQRPFQESANMPPVARDLSTLEGNDEAKHPSTAR